MTFDPLPKQVLTIDGISYQVAEHPNAPGIPYGQEGRAAIVYKLENKRGARALKVFKSHYRTPALVSLAEKLAPLADLPGLMVCRRSVLTSLQHNDLLHEHPDLSYAVLMPWVDGQTWQQILGEKIPLTQEQSLSIARSLSIILTKMEQRGIAHCDLSSANLVLPILEKNYDPSFSAALELVDVEQIYANYLEQPEAVPSGSDGYSHKSVRREKIWNARADRFAGAILLAEMLAWCDPAIREAAWGESYFDPNEMQLSSTRFHLLCQALSNRWGQRTSDLLNRAWSSDILAECPTFDEWLVALPKSVPSPSIPVAPIIRNETPPDAEPARMDLPVTLAQESRVTPVLDLETSKPVMPELDKKEPRIIPVQKTNKFRWGLIFPLLICIFVIGILIAASSSANKAQVQPTPAAAQLISTSTLQDTQNPTNVVKVNLQAAPSNTPIGIRTNEVTITMSPGGHDGITCSINVATANARQGPGKNYPIFAYLNPGSFCYAIGKNSDGSWIAIRLDDGRTAWISSTLIDSESSLNALPLMAIPPAPTTESTWTPAPRPGGNNPNPNPYPYP